jgi:hypothetical protein
MAIDTQPDLRVDDEERERHVSDRSRAPAAIVGILLILVLAAAGWWWYRSRTVPAPAPAAPVAVAPAAPASAAAPAASSYPLEIPEGTAALAPGDVQPALVDLLGRDAVTRFLDTADFPRKVVATVDNLGRAHAPTAAWPVHPTPGQFAVDTQGDATTIAAANASRYAPFVDLATRVDTKKAVDLYRRLYPLLQSSYRELGFGDRNFNDRVVQVIDLMLATPEPATPPRVQLTEVKGPYASERPWVRYQYTDPALQSLASGQKILLRMGPDNERRVKQKLRELRAELVTGR